MADKPLTAPTDDQLAQSAVRLVKAGEDAHKVRLPRYNHSYNVWRAISGVAGGDPWQSKLRIPYAMSNIETALVNIVSGQPRIICKPRRPQDELAAKAMQMILDYYIAEDHLVEKQPSFVQQALIYGVTVAKNHWLYREGMRPGRAFDVNPLDPSKPVPRATVERVVFRDGPTFEPWNIYDAFWDPNGRTVDDCAYVCLDSWISRTDLEKQRYNPDNSTGLYHNLDLLFASGNRGPQEQSAQDQRNNASQNKKQGMFHLREIWRDDQLIVIGNGQVVLRNEPNPYWHGEKPVVIAQTRPDLFEISGIPETELLDHIQNAIWTVKNMRIDNAHLTVMRGITYREGGVTDPGSLQLRPRFKWAVTDHDDIRPFEVQPLPPEAYREEDVLKGDGQQITGITPYVTGADMSGVDQNTATGVTALQEVASRLLRFKAAQIHYKGYQRSFEQWGDMTQQFLDTNQALKIIGQDGQEQWVEVGPADVAGHFHYKLEGSEESLSRQQERSEAIQLLNAMAPFVQLGVVNPAPLLEKVAAAFDFNSPEALIRPPAPQGPPAAPVPPGATPVSQFLQAQSQGLRQPNGQGQLVGGQTLSPVIQQAIGGR